jgi:hypothetical protein
MSSSPGSGRVQKGTANAAGDCTGGLQQPSGLNCPQRSFGFEAGYRRCQGEAMQGNLLLKTVSESSVWSKNSRSARMQPAPGRCFSMTGCARYGHAAATSRFGVRSVLPGVQPSTYRTTGSSFEHGNPDPSAGPAKSGKPTGLAMSRTGGGASVVVRARESRAHGEGRQ